MLLRCLPIQRFILSNKSFLFGIRFLWCFSLSPYDSTSFEGVAPSFLPSFSILKVMPGSHLLSRSLAPQYYRPAVSLPSCSGWERVFLTAASPPDNYFLEYYFISDLLFLDQFSFSNQQRVNTQTPTFSLERR